MLYASNRKPLQMTRTKLRESLDVLIHLKAFSIADNQSNQCSDLPIDSRPVLGSSR